MEPGGTRRSSPRTASTGPKCFRRSDVSMTNASATVRSCSAQSRKLRLEQSSDLLVAHTPRAQPLDRRRDDGLPRTKLLGQLFSAGVRRHERAGAVPELDEAFVLQLAVGLGDGVRVDDEVLGKRTYPRQLFARSQRAGLDGVLHLLHQLEVNRGTERRVRAEDHCVAAVLLM